MNKKAVEEEKEIKKKRLKRNEGKGERDSEL